MKKQTLRGISFEYSYKGEVIKSTITRDYPKAVRVVINDTIQAVWLPKNYLCLKDGRLLVGTLDWKLKSEEFQKKLKLSRESEAYEERRKFYRDGYYE